MTHREIAENLSENVQKALLENRNIDWEDLRVEYAIQDPFHPGYLITVWGEELEADPSDICPDDTKYFSVAIHKQTDTGNPTETLCTATSKSPDLQDLEVAVFAALRQLEHYHTQSLKQGKGRRSLECR